jgi:phospholipid/cholesterol/gamma-HCH transport system permease protein
MSETRAQTSIESAGAAGPGLQIDFESTADALEIRLGGTWSIAEGLPSSEIATPRLADPSLRRVVLDAAAIGEWDSSLLSFLVGITRSCRQRGIEIDAERLPDGVGELLALAFAVPQKEDTGREQTTDSWVARVGRRALDALSSGRAMLAFVGDAVISMGRFFTGRARYRRRDLWLFAQQCGADAVPIVSLISFLVGLILAFVGVQQLKLFGAEIFVANLVGIAMAREMGCIMTGIIMAGRTGAAFAAQLGTMTVNEEIDALQTLGIPPMDFLVLPRMLALVIMMPLLVLYADAVGIIGGAIIGVTSSDLTMTQYFMQTQASLGLDQVVIGVVKASVFGVLVAVAGCLRGMQCGRSASAVGDAATSAVVLGIVWIIVMDAIFAVALDSLGI